MVLLWGAVLNFSPSECCFRTRELLQQQAAARDDAAATAAPAKILCRAMRRDNGADMVTNIYLFVFLNCDDSAKAHLAALAPAHVRAVQPALLDPLPARPCDNPPIARLFHLQEPHVCLTFQVWTQLRERVRWSFNFSSTA